MITNPGFSFSGISGDHKIIPTAQTDLPIWGPLYSDTVVCTCEKELVKVYDNGPGFHYMDNSVAMDFAAIDVTDKDAIIKFCNRYGMPDSMRQFGNHRNDYLFFNTNKDEFSKVVPLGVKQERVWVFAIQREIIQMKKCIELNQAIQDKDFIEIIKILLYFCFDLYGLDFDGSERRTESFQFNHHFFRYAEQNGYSKMDGFSNTTLHNLVIGFLDDINSAYAESEFYSSHRIPHKDKYVQIYFSMWQHLHSIFSWLTEQVTISAIDPFGNVTFDKLLMQDFSEVGEKDISRLLNTAKGLFSDIFKEKLHAVYPEIIFGADGIPESSWRIPTLIDAMYLELFFRFTPNTSVRKCMNPTCPKFFTRTSSRPTKIYCDESCAKLMAKRKERERKRKTREENAIK